MTRCGSPCWTAPEIIRGEKYTEKADVYSFGMLALASLSYDTCLTQWYSLFWMILERYSLRGLSSSFLHTPINPLQYFLLLTWSLAGIVLWEIVSRQQPYKDRNFMSVGLDVLNGLRPSIPESCPKPYAKMMKQCWHADPDNRPSMQKVLHFFDQLLGEGEEKAADDAHSGEYDGDE